MARGTDPLRRDTIQIAARLPSLGVQAPAANHALRLASALGQFTPEADQAIQAYQRDQAQRARSQAQRDAISAAGADLAEATRSGRIRPTQNPWYIDAYNREAAAVRAQDQLAALQTEAASWEERTNPEAFAARWREEVGALAQGYEGAEQSAGFVAAERAASSQVLQQNTARNTARIESEREANLSRLTADALSRVYMANGGRMTPNQAWDALLPARQQWFATGGDQEGWNNIAREAIISTAHAHEDPDFVYLTRAPELLSGPSEAGAQEVYSRDGGYQGITVTEVPPSTAAQDGADAGAPPPPPTLTISAPRRQGFNLPSPVANGQVTSSFNAQRTRGRHTGVDIAAPLDTPIQAQAPGRVVAVGVEGDAGVVVRVDYGNGVESSYAHMQAGSPGVAVGDIVAAGQTLGRVGMTGHTTGPHVHQVVRVNGERVDPVQFNAEVGGDFEGVPPSTPAAAQSFPGFPGADQPYTSTSGPLPPHTYTAGPSLYGTGDAAGDIENAHYRISQAAEDAPMRRIRERENLRRERAYAARDDLYQRHGTGLITGAVTRETIIQELSQQGYSAPEIAMALSLVREPLQDSVGVANAQVAARGSNPQAALSIMDLEMDGQRDGYSDNYDPRVSDAILRGDITGDDGRRMVGNALSRTRQLQSEANQAASEARAEARYQQSIQPEGAQVRNAADLVDLSKNLASAAVLAVQQRTGSAQAIDAEDTIAASAMRAARAHLASNAGDWDGAVQAARAEAARLGQALQTRLTTRAQAATGTPAGGANPRRPHTTTLE